MSITPRTMRLLTLGCKVNQYETQHVKELLEANGYLEAEEGQRADLCVVNTCTVTHEGDAKSRQTIRRLSQQQPNSAVVVMGCYATRDPDAVRKLPGVTKVITDKQHLVEELEPFGVTTAVSGISRFDDHQRAFVKVQDGCLLNCSYCIIPSVRPVVRSRPIEEIEAEVLRLHESGYREIVLTGIHLGHYGIDLSRGKSRGDWTRLWHLLDRLERLPGDFRVRLSSLEAAEARADLIRAMRDNSRVCPHLHLCLQSGSDRILSVMKRRYRRAGFLERCRRIRESLDQPAFTTDVILGFPGETEEDFEATCEVIREVGFCKVHLFSYSPRAGTAAATIKQTVSPIVMNERRERLRDLEAELQREYQQRLIGRTLDVVAEGASPSRPGHVEGTSCRAVVVRFPGDAQSLLRTRVRVKIRALEPHGLLGDPVLEKTAPRLALPMRFEQG